MNTDQFWYGFAAAVGAVCILWVIYSIFRWFIVHSDDHFTIKHLGQTYATKSELAGLNHRHWSLNERVCKLEEADAERVKDKYTSQEYKLRKADQ